MEFVKNHKGLTVLVAGIVAMVVLVISMVSYINSVRDEGIRMESALNAEYSSGQSILSTTTNSAIETMGIADQGADKMGSIIIDAVKGRYDGAMEPGTSGGMFSAITEDYPDVTKNVELYAKAQTVVEAGRASFNGHQRKMQSMVSSYDTWKKSGLFKSQVVNNILGFPSTDLRAKVGGVTYTGEDALDQMRNVIMSSEAAKSFETGISDPLFGNK